MSPLFTGSKFGFFSSPPLIIGQPYGGGYFAGYISHSADGVPTHILIVSPKEVGQSSLTYKIDNSSTTGTTNTFDGRFNTDFFLADSISKYPAGQFCVNLSIDGYTDWYLPSTYELDIAYFNLKPGTSSNITTGTTGVNIYAVPRRDVNFTTTNPRQTTATIFRTGGAQAFDAESYRTSDGSAGGVALTFNFGFGSKSTSGILQSQASRFRAFRKIKLQKDIITFSSASLDSYYNNVTLLLHMDDGVAATPTRKDSSPYNFTPVLINDPQVTILYSKFGWKSSDMKTIFGPDSYWYPYTIQHDLLGGDFTVECWIFLTSTVDGKRIAASGGGAVTYNTTNGIHWALLLRNSGGNLELAIYTTSGVNRVTTTGTITLNRWNHVAASVSGTTVYVSINGVVESGTISTVQRPSTNPNLTIGNIFGDSTASNSTAFDGYMDEFRITKGVARYTSNFTPPSGPLPYPDAIPVAADPTTDPQFSNVSLLLAMNGANNSTSFIDSSSNNFTVTRNGNLSITTSERLFNNSSGYFNTVYNNANHAYLTIPHNNAFEFDSGDFTIEFFALFTEFGGSTICIYNKGAIRIDGDRFNGGRLYLTVIDSTSTNLFNSSAYNIEGIPVGTWHHFALTREGNTFRTFLNGVVRGTVTSSNAIQSSSSTMFIGAANAASNGFSNFYGYLSNFRITKGVARYTSNFTPSLYAFPTS